MSAAARKLDPQTDANLTAAALAVGRILGIGSIPDSIIDIMKQRMTDSLTPQQRRDPLSVYSPQILGLVTEYVKDAYGIGRPANLHGAPAPVGADRSTDQGFFNAQGLSRFDQMIAGNRIAGFASGSSAYSGLAGSTYDPAKGIGSLTAQNFDSSPFKAAGLDFATTRALAAQGFGPQAILQAASLGRELGIDVNAHAGSIARLQRDVPGVSGTLRTLRQINNEISAAEAAAANAKTPEERAKHERRAEEARRRRKEIEDKKEEEIRKRHPNKPGLIDDWRKITGAMKSADAKIDADLKAGRITQAEAAVQREVARTGVSSQRIQNAALHAEAERKAAARPGTAVPRREVEIAAIKKESVKPVGVIAAQAIHADAFAGEDTPPTVPPTRTAEKKPDPPNPPEARTAEARPPDQPQETPDKPKKKTSVAAAGPPAPSNG